MELHIALKIAERVKKELEQYCDKIMIAGSIRRRKHLVNDIEIVCVPKESMVLVKDHDLFGDTTIKDAVGVRHPGFAETVNKWQKIIGEPSGKNTRRLLPEGIVLDLFICNPDNYGYILAIRTGPKEFCTGKLIPYWVKAGFQGKDGGLWRGQKQIPVPTELDLFKLIDFHYVEPQNRK